MRKPRWKLIMVMGWCCLFVLPMIATAAIGYTHSLSLELGHIHLTATSESTGPVSEEAMGEEILRSESIIPAEEISSEDRLQEETQLSDTMETTSADLVNQKPAVEEIEVLGD